MTGPLKSEPVVSSAVVLTSQLLPKLLLLLFLFFFNRIQVLDSSFCRTVQVCINKLSLPGSARPLKNISVTTLVISSAIWNQGPRVRCDNCETTRAKLPDPDHGSGPGPASSPGPDPGPDLGPGPGPDPY